MSTQSTSAISIRHATAADARTLADLAALDDRAPLAGPALIGEVDGIPRAALDLGDFTVAADPFVRTVELVELLWLHAGRRRRRRGRIGALVAARSPVTAVRA